MFYIPLWKKLTIAFVCAFGMFYAFPNILSEQTRAQLPSYLPQDKINLGLDLRGGSHLLLRLDMPAYLAEHYQTLKDDLRSAMRKERIGYRNLSAKADEVRLDLRNAERDTLALQKLIARLDDALELEITGEQVQIRYSEMARAQKQKQLLEQSIEIINRRINQTGTKEPVIQRQGDDRVLVQVPGMDNPEQLKVILGKTAKMTFHLVNESVADVRQGRGILPADTMRLPYQDGDPAEPTALRRESVPVYRRVELSGELLTAAAATFSQGQPVVSFKFNAQGAAKFGRITQEHVGQRFAVVLDGKVITAPVMRSPILDGSGIIEGSFTVESASELAMLLRAGALPAPLTIIEERSVGPSLGADSIAAGEMAVVIAFAAIMVFMLLYYGIYGLFSNIALLMNVVLIVAVLSLFQATLTLPGIAGIVLTMGMAVDANTLIFERIREEIRLGKGIRASVEHGFNSAFGTILDANVTTLIAAFILFYFGSGTVKGFAVTLSIGILASMFSAIMLSRFLVMSYVSWKRPATLKI